MYIIKLTYTVSLETVDRYLAAHVEFLEEQYKNGYFLMSGRTVPRTGGVILSNVSDRDALVAILEKDPFKKNNIASYEIITFVPSKTCESLSFLAEE